MIPGIWRYNPASTWVNSATFLACMPEAVKAPAAAIEIDYNTLFRRVKKIARSVLCMLAALLVASLNIADQEIRREGMVRGGWRLISCT